MHCYTVELLFDLRKAKQSSAGCRVSTANIPQSTSRRAVPLQQPRLYLSAVLCVCVCVRVRPSWGSRVRVGVTLGDTENLAHFL